MAGNPQCSLACRGLAPQMAPFTQMGGREGRDGLRAGAGRRTRTWQLTSEAGSEKRTQGPLPPDGISHLASQLHPPGPASIASHSSCLSRVLLQTCGHLQGGCLTHSPGLTLVTRLEDSLPSPLPPTRASYRTLDTSFHWPTSRARAPAKQDLYF